MAVPVIQTAFTSGELTPSLFGHVDLARFHVGAATMRNAFVSYRGGAYSRAGTAFIGFSAQTGRAIPPRLIPFQFSINQGLALEFGNLYMRVISNGAYVVEASTAITAISQAAPAVVTTANSLTTGDWVYLSGIAGMTQLNGRIAVAHAVTGAHISLYDVFGNPIDTTSFSAYTSGGTVARIFTLVTPWAEVDLPYLKFAQSADVMSICCWNQLTGTNYPSYDLARVSDSNWTLTKIDPKPTITAPTTCTAVPTIAGSGAYYQYEVTAVSLVDGTESIASPIGSAANVTDIAQAGAILVTWSAVAGAENYNIYKAQPGLETPVPAGAQYGFIGQAQGTQLVDSNIVSDFTQVPPTHTNPFAPGGVIKVNITGAGTGLTTVTWAITTSTGSGFNGYPIIVGGQLSAFVITDNGEGYAPGDSIAFNGAGFAAGAITFSANPTAADTITLNSVVWTFVSAITGANQTLVKSTLALTISQLVTDLAASGNASLIVATYGSFASGSNVVLSVTYNTAGTGGNAYTLAASVATPSGTHLTGGGGTSGTAPTATLTIGPASGTYPSVTAYFQERRAYAASPLNPDTYWMSQPGAFLNFDVRNPTIASDAITGTPWSVEVNGIQFMVSMPGGLVVLTGLSAWQLTGVGGSSLNPQPLTPSNQQAQPQAYNGCSATVPPIKIDNNILFVQAKGSVVRNFEYNFFTNIYTGTDQTQLSSHLFTGYAIKEWAWAEEPYKILWAVRNDGILLSLTYLKQQDVAGWARHDTNGLVQSVCSVTEPPVDAVYIAVERFTPNGTAYMIERMDNRIWASREDCWCVDSGLSYPMPTPNATLTASSPTGLGAIINIDLLIGGQNYSNLTVVNITDPTGQGAALTPVIGAGGVITGVTINSSGTGYTDPQFSFYDPSGEGTGAELNLVTLDNSATFTASAAIFTSGSTGSYIRMGGGVAVITSYISTTQVIADIQQPIVTIVPNSSPIMVTPATAGNWTLTAPTSVIYGLDHLAGMTVTGLSDGQVVPPLTVSATGSVNLGEYTGSAITLGLSFTAQLQSVYVDVGQPTVQGQRKKVAAVTARVEASSGMMVGSDQVDGSTLSPTQIAPTWRNLDTVPEGGTPVYGAAYPPLYTGDIRIPVSGGFQRPGQVAIQQTLPLPMNVLAFIPEIDAGDLPQPPGPVARPQQQQRGR